MKPIRLADTRKMSHDEWLQMRRLGIGGSDVAAICNMNRYKSAMNVYLDKLGEIPPLEDNPRMRAGRELEEPIAQWFAKDTGFKIRKRNAIFQHPEHPFMLANIDREIVGSENAGLEIKNTSEYCRDDWSGTQAPTEYILQCNHYMAVTGKERWYICVLIGGWDLQWRVIERDEELIQNLITIEKEFWEGHVLAKIPPAFSHQDSDYLKGQYPQSVETERVHLTEAEYPIMQSLFEARRLKKVSEEREEAAKNQIKGIMGEAERAYYEGELRFTWKTGSKSRTFRVVGGEE
ncbi:endonuclease [Paenibacillus sp. 598K]|uniref:YqaJ viral recombinase family nuclease n=1 Tax=Paenibacillus sp. 598K TaxID=1117987 RepID=UPI000FFA296B|nr:YqaJ viral recombinase family protein [Paenibacillus sp. 598K]GBF73169.1 endonuclease [Paenibacillus sp. 598K]